MSESSDGVGGSESKDSADRGQQSDRSVADAARSTEQAMRSTETQAPDAASEADLAAGVAAREALEAQERAAMDRTRAAAREALGVAGETPAEADPAAEEAAPNTYADSYASQTLSGINQGIADVLGGPIDLAEAGLNGLSNVADWAGVPEEYTPEFSGSFLGSDHISGMMSDFGAIARESADPAKQRVREAAGLVTEIGSAFLGVGAARLAEYSLQADEAIEAVADLSPDAVDLALSYKPGWSDAQRLAADGKVQALTEADTVVTTVERSMTSARRRFVAEVGEVPTGMDVDHIQDLQLGGADEILNMSPLDRSVNRSLGAQIQHRIKDLPVGTPVDRVTIGDR